MKTVILALLVLLVVSQGEALECWCGGTKRCSGGRTETCRGSNDVCASVTYDFSPRNNFHGCYDEDDCKRMNLLGGNCGCCRTDRCQALFSRC